MKRWTEVMKNLTMLTQLGLSFIMPLLMCIVLCWWLTDRFGIGGWVFIPGFFLGLGGSGMVAYKVYLSVMKQEKKRNQKKKVSFNRHL